MKKLILFSMLLLNGSNFLISQPNDNPAASFLPCNHSSIDPWQYCEQCNPNPCAPPVAPANQASVVSKKTSWGILPYVPYAFAGMVFDGMVVKPYCDSLKKNLEAHSWDQGCKIELRIVRRGRVGFYMLVAYQTGKTVRTWLEKTIQNN